MPYVEFDTKDGGKLLVEVDEPEGRRSGVGFTGGKDTVKSPPRRPGAGGSPRRGDPSAGRRIDEAVRSPPDPADEVEVTFALKVKGDLGNEVVAKLAGDVNYSVKLKWTGTKPK